MAIYLTVSWEVGERVQVSIILKTFKHFSKHSWKEYTSILSVGQNKISFNWLGSDKNLMADFWKSNLIIFTPGNDKSVISP